MFPVGNGHGSAAPFLESCFVYSGTLEALKVLSSFFHNSACLEHDYFEENFEDTFSWWFSFLFSNWIHQPCPRSSYKEAPLSTGEILLVFKNVCPNLSQLSFHPSLVVLSCVPSSFPPPPSAHWPLLTPTDRNWLFSGDCKAEWVRAQTLHEVPWAQALPLPLPRCVPWAHPCPFCASVSSSVKQWK